MQVHPDALAEMDDDTFHGDVLRDLIHLGDRMTSLLDDIRDRLTQHDGPVTEVLAAAERLVSVYDRGSRTLRRNIVTRDHLLHRQRAREAHRTAARRQVIRRVEDKIKATIPVDHPEAAESFETLDRALAERLENPELDADIEVFPVDQVAREIEQDFGLGAAAAHTRRRTQSDIARLHAKAAHLPSTPERHHHQAAIPNPV